MSKLRNISNAYHWIILLQHNHVHVISQNHTQIEHKFCTTFYTCSHITQKKNNTLEIHITYIVLSYWINIPHSDSNIVP